MQIVLQFVILCILTSHDIEYGECHSPLWTEYQTNGWKQSGLVTSLIQAHDVISQVGATSGSHDFDSSQVFADLDADLANLKCQLTGGDHDKC